MILLILSLYNLAVKGLRDQLKGPAVDLVVVGFQLTAFRLVQSLNQ